MQYRLRQISASNKFRRRTSRREPCATLWRQSRAVIDESGIDRDTIASRRRPGRGACWWSRISRRLWRWQAASTSSTTAISPTRLQRARSRRSRRFFTAISAFRPKRRGRAQTVSGGGEPDRGIFTRHARRRCRILLSFNDRAPSLWIRCVVDATSAVKSPRFNIALGLLLVALTVAMLVVARPRDGAAVWFLKSWIVGQVYVMAALVSAVSGAALMISNW